MNRQEVLKIVEELLGLLNSKNMTPSEAESISIILQSSIQENNEKNIKGYMENGVFSGSPPEC